MDDFYKYCEDKKITGNFREALFHRLMSEEKTNPTREEVDAAWTNVLDDLMANQRRAVERYLQRCNDKVSQ